jgi:hypothetical protein
MKRLPSARLRWLLYVAASLALTLGWRSQGVDDRYETFRLASLVSDSGELICSPFVPVERVNAIRRAHPEADVRALPFEYMLVPSPAGQPPKPLPRGISLPIDDSWEPF